jgi:hypothetical protein
MYMFSTCEIIFSILTSGWLNKGYDVKSIDKVNYLYMCM